jgi:hypothetical protein
MFGEERTIGRERVADKRKRKRNGKTGLAKESREM